ncbi:hypothetical protein QBC36DRAFT_369731 [Triangularia setosa]|uniref:Uncharacterized protein n=1 Tax=Triangularia setosa TaxID=2587417 RepID=A0AAN6WAI3_9PEZI|nr:hypothetical protein QBC36DRAFT_369731 [Podospora setosa]
MAAISPTTFTISKNNYCQGQSFLMATRWIQEEYDIHPVILQGFPTTHRPPLSPGGEFDSVMLVNLFRFRWHQRDTNCEEVVLAGDLWSLQFVKQSLGVYVWHIFDSKKTARCECWQYLRQKGDQDVAEISFRSSDLPRRRHIVADCESTLAWLQTWPSTASVDCELLDNLSTALTDEITTGISTEQQSGPGTSEGSTEISLDPEILSISDTPSNHDFRIPFEYLDSPSSVITIIAHPIYLTFLSMVARPVVPLSPRFTTSVQLEETMDFRAPEDGDARSTQHRPCVGPSSSSGSGSSSKAGASTAQSLKRSRGNDQDEGGGERPK